MLSPIERDTHWVPHCRYFVVTREGEGKMSQLSPFFVDKTLRLAVGELKSIRRQRNGDLIVETRSSEQSTKLSKLSRLSDSVNVKVTPHRTFNSVRGVFTSDSLNGISDDEILEELKKENVISLKRLTKKVNGISTYTNSYLVNIAKNELPNEIRVGYLQLPLRQYIPLPTRCFRCFGFNHQANNCTKPQICYLCAEIRHDGVPCSKPEVCTNCGGPHRSVSNQCPHWIKERKIKEIQTLQKISYFLAKQKIEAPSKSYAQIASKSTSSNFIREHCPHCSHCKSNVQQDNQVKMSETTQSSLTDKNISRTQVICSNEVLKNTREEMQIQDEKKCNKKETENHGSSLNPTSKSTTETVPDTLPSKVVNEHEKTIHINSKVKSKIIQQQIEKVEVPIKKKRKKSKSPK